jgi:hypothetical protein
MNDGEPKDDAVWRERRCEPREPAHDPARLVLERDVVIDALIVDRSVKGMRLRLPHGASVASNLTLTALDLNRAMIHQVKVMWKAYPDVGVRVQSSFNVRIGEGPQAAAMRRLWSRATAPRAEPGSLAPRVRR